MAFEDYKKCPVDGTRFFYRTETYPLGRPHGTRFCSTGCEARATYGEGRTAPFYVPDVDGVNGSTMERENGGPLKCPGFDVKPKREYVSLPGDGVTARPSGGGDLGEYSELVEGYATGHSRGGRS